MDREYRPTRTDTYKLTIAGLVTKRAEIAGEREKAIERLAEINHAIAHLDAVLEMFGFTDVKSIKPLRRASSPRASRFDTRGRKAAILDAMRDALDGSTTPQITDAVMAAYRLNADQEPLRNNVMADVRKVLHRLEGKGIVRRDGWLGDARVWRLVQQ